MALAGTLYSEWKNSRRLRIQWTVTSQDHIANTSTIKLVFACYSDRPTAYTGEAYQYRFDGQTTTINWSGTLTSGSWTSLRTVTLTVSHDDDGVGSFPIYFAFPYYKSSDTMVINDNIIVDTIPRATTPTLSASSVNMGSSVTITLNRASSEFTHKLTYSFGSLTNQTSGIGNASSAGTSTTFAPPMILANQIPSATSGTCTIRCQTYNGLTLIGEKSVALTLTVPSSIVPTISNVSIAEATSGIASKFNAFVQNKSKLSVAISAAGSYGSTISSYETYIQSVPYRSSSFTSAVITESGTVDVVTIVTDTRGRTAQVTNSVTVLPYSAPVINSMSAFRITTAGDPSDDGNRIAVSMSFAISSVNGLNTRTFALKYKKSSDTEFTTFSSGTASTAYDDTQYFTSSPEISTDYAYVIRLEISDFFTTTVFEVNVSTAFTIMDFRSTGKGMAIGKVSEKDALEIAMDAEITGKAKIYVSENEYLRLYRSDGTLAALLSSDTGDDLNINFYKNGSLTGVTKFSSDGSITLSNHNSPVGTVIASHNYSASVSCPSGTRTVVDTITLPPGTWLVEYGGVFAANATGYRQFTISPSNQMQEWRQFYHRKGAETGGITTMLKATATEHPTVETVYNLYALQNSGSELTTYPYMMAVRIA